MFSAVGGGVDANTSSLLDRVFWQRFWSSYVHTFIDAQGRDIDWQRHDVTTSKGQAYALFFSLIANQPHEFALILSWINNNLASGQLGKKLPGWLWGRNAEGHWILLSPHSAADADLWIAYTLVQADRLWRIPRYIYEGQTLMHTIA